MQKSIVLAFLALCGSICVEAQQGKPKPTPAKPATPAKTTTQAKPVNPLKNAVDSASYAIGVFVVNFYRQQGITRINTAMVARAISEIQDNKARLLTDDQANTAIMNYLNGLQKEKVKPNLEKGEKFLAENKKRPGVITTPSGLQYEIITQGTGPIPMKTDTVIVHYIGKFADGTEFESSYKNGAPVRFAAGGVIAGWTEALLMMPAGSKWKLFIPYQLGYGMNDYYSIPGGSALIFEVELVGIVGK